MAISNSADAYYIQYKVLTATGVWPKENSFIFYRIKTLISWIFGLCLCGIMFTQVIHDIQDFIKLSETLYIMVSFLCYLIKLTVFTIKKKEILKILDCIKDPIFLSYPDDLDHCMKRIIKYSTNLAKLYQFLIVCCIVLYLIFPILDNKPLPFAFPYDLGEYNIAMYGFQLIGEYYSVQNNINIDLLCTSLMGIAAGHLDILCEKLVRIKERSGIAEDDQDADQVDDVVVEELKGCVKYHLAIINFVNALEDMFTIPLLSQLFTSALVICNTLFDFVLVPMSLQTFLLVDYIFIILIQLFIYCWFGNEIMIKVGEACYMSSWYICNNKVRKYLFIIMERTKRPLTMSAMKLSVLSLMSFTKILQWSYSYLALLMNMYSKKTENVN